MVKLLEKNHFETFTAGNGIEAIAIGECETGLASISKPFSPQKIVDTINELLKTTLLPVI